MTVNDPEATDATAIAHYVEASPEYVAEVLTAPVDRYREDGRSPFVWLCLPDGSLFLGVFPMGDVYLHALDMANVDLAVSPVTPIYH